MTRWRVLIGGLTCFGLIGVLGASLGQPPADNRKDVGKRRIEFPTERVLGGQPEAPKPPARAGDSAKPTIEAPVENAITNGPGRVTPAAPAPAVVIPAPQPVFAPKGAIELPTKKLVENAASPALDQARRVYLPKSDIEAPTKKVVAAGAAPVPAASVDFVNPKVAPGKVQWHADLATACAAAARSGKPVLLFQMMGKLDDQFC
jgi:hypothetical protein